MVWMGPPAGLHHGTVAAAVGIVVHLPLLVAGVIPDLMAVDADDIPFLGPSQDGFTEHVPHHVREKGHDMDVIAKVHVVTSLR